MLGIPCVERPVIGVTKDPAFRRVIQHGEFKSWVRLVMIYNFQWDKAHTSRLKRVTAEALEDGGVVFKPG